VCEVDATTAPALVRWFQIMDSDEPDGILDRMADDFQFSVVFSTGDARSSDFAGGRAAMGDYLAQRERGTRVHRLLAVSTAGDTEFALGEVIRLGQWEATFVASALRDGDGRLRRLIIGRSPGVAFPPAAAGG
jgi:ketosteroid isomerase-like protein